jgi:uncharacterized membrane protein YqjE
VSKPGAAGGLFESLRQLTHTAIGIAQVRVELFGTELEQEKLRLFDAAVWALAALLALWLAAVLVIAFVVLLFWEGYRLAAVGTLAVLFVGLGVWLLRSAQQRLRAPEGGAFALSLAELRRDRDSLGRPTE